VTTTMCAIAGAIIGQLDRDSARKPA